MAKSNLNIHRSTMFLEKLIVKITPICLLYCMFYKKAVLNEAELAKLKDTDTLLFVGGGAIPYTAMILSRYVKHVTIIDHDECSSNLAQKLVSKLRMKNITIIHTKGEELDTSPYTVIFIPLQAEPKNIILKNIRKKSCKHTKIIMRIPKKSFDNVYTSLEELPIKNYSFKDIKQLTFDKVICFECGELL